MGKNPWNRHSFREKGISSLRGVKERDQRERKSSKKNGGYKGRKTLLNNKGGEIKNLECPLLQFFKGKGRTLAGKGKEIGSKEGLLTRGKVGPDKRAASFWGEITEGKGSERYSKEGGLHSGGISKMKGKKKLAYGKKIKVDRGGEHANKN